MESLPIELVNTVLWYVVFIHLTSWTYNTRQILDLLHVCKQWRRILTNINTMVIPPSRLPDILMYWVLRINQQTILPKTIAQYFPLGQLEQEYHYNDIMYAFCTAYHKRSWQHMLLPTVDNLKEYHQRRCIMHGIPHTNGLMNYTALLSKCQSMDSFYYLYHLGDKISVFNFDAILYHLTSLAKVGRCHCKHINWLINLYIYGSVRIEYRGTHEIGYYWTNSFRHLIQLNYSAEKLRRLCLQIKKPWTQLSVLNTMLDHYKYWRTIQLSKENQIGWRERSKWQEQLKKFDREIMYCEIWLDGFDSKNVKL